LYGVKEADQKKLIFKNHGKLYTENWMRPKNKYIKKQGKFDGG